MVVLDLQIGERSSTTGTPVDQSFPAIDQPLFIQADKDLSNCSRQPFVKRKPFPGPIARGADTAYLFKDDSAIFLLPFPNTFHKLFASQIVSCQSLLTKFLLDNVLRR